MTDLRDQLQAYYDEVVQRVDVTAPGRLRSESAPRPFSKWVAVAVAAALTLVVGVSTVLLVGNTDDGQGQTGAIEGSGAFTWTRHPLDGPITYPAAWNGGYVAIRGGEIVFSPDGISDWDPWPSQPFEGQFDPERDDHRALVVSGGTLLAVASTEDSLSAYATTDGRSWTDIPFEAAAGQDRGRAFTLHAGSAGVFVVGTNARELPDNEGILSPAWVLSGEGFTLYPEPQALRAPVWAGWNTDVWTIWHGEDAIWPGEVLAGAEKDGRLTGFGWQLEGITEDGVELLDPPRPAAYTSTDGNAWQPLDPVTAPADASLCDPKPPAIIPEIVETGPLGWFAAGSSCAPGVIWASSDGLEWHELDGVAGLAGWDEFRPFAPVFLIEEERVLIYATQDYPRESFWNVWVGTPTGRAVGTPGRVTIVFEQLRESWGLVVESRILPTDPTEEVLVLGATHSSVTHTPFSMTEVVRLPDPDAFGLPEGEIAILEPGTYRFTIEAYVSAGPMKFGCERPIEISEGEALTITISELPPYSGDSFFWTPVENLEDLRYPDCPESVRVVGVGG